MAPIPDSISAIILAAGKGTRLNEGNPSPKPKVLYEINNRPMIFYALDNLREIGINPERTILVVGYLHDRVEDVVGPNYRYALQDPPRGTGHALDCGLKEVSEKTEIILAMNGDDSAFYTPSTLESVLKEHINSQSVITFVTLEKDQPMGLGRVVRDAEGNLEGIVEERDANDSQRQIKEVNDGLYIFKREWLDNNITRLRPNANGELYLTDLIAIALGQGEVVSTYKLGNSKEWHGVNTLKELEQANDLMTK